MFFFRFLTYLSKKMDSKIPSISHRILVLNTLAMLACFAAWTLNGVLVTYLVSTGVFDWNSIQSGWLIGIPVLMGAIVRVPVGILTDKLGGKWIFTGLMLVCALFLYILSFATGFISYALASFGTGVAGGCFAVAIGYTSVWYPIKWQGTALGIVGFGVAGASITGLLAPSLLDSFTNGGTNPENWRLLPRVYAAGMTAMAVLFIFFTTNKKPLNSNVSFSLVMKRIKNPKILRLGFYYFLTLGGFVSFAQWLIPYSLNVYGITLVQAGILASAFSLPTGLIGVIGGWWADKYGARAVVMATFQISILLSLMLLIPKMDIYTPGKGVLSTLNGTVTSVSLDEITVDNVVFPVVAKASEQERIDTPTYWDKIFPAKFNWQETNVSVGQVVGKKTLLAKGVTLISCQANFWVFAILTVLIGSAWGVSMSGIVKFIPDYFPNEVGVVGGIVAFLGALGGFVCPILFGYLLRWTGLWTSSWFLILLLSVACLWLLTKVAISYVPHNYDQEV